MEKINTRVGAEAATFADQSTLIDKMYRNYQLIDKIISTASQAIAFITLHAIL